MYSLQIDLLQPNKSDVIPFLDSAAGEPKRYARSTIQFSSFEQPYLQEYIVGPLPATNVTQVEPLRFPFNNRKSGKSRVPNVFTLDIQEWIAQLSVETEDITRELWNTVYYQAYHPKPANS